ncbi:MAG TPA: phasin family protein, partial [Marinobacter sp.]
MSDRKQDKEAQDKARSLKGIGDGALDLRKYTHQIWLAGLGAFARAEE